MRTMQVNFTQVDTIQVDTMQVGVVTSATAPRQCLRASARVLRVEPVRRKPSAARPRQDLALSQLHWVIEARASNTQELRTSVSPTPSVFDLNQRHLH